MGGSRQFVLYEAASGYSLYDCVAKEDIGSFQTDALELSKFSKNVKLVAFLPFTSAENALENIMAISEHNCTEDLMKFLEMNLPSAKKSKKSAYTLGVGAPELGRSIQESTKFPCNSNEFVLEVIRGIRLHYNRIVKGLDNGVAERAQLGLGHSYSRAKVKFNVNRQDNMIIQAICLLDQLDKDLNTNAMRAKEWYSWHFPELGKLVPDPFMFCRMVNFIGPRSALKPDRLSDLEEITMDDTLAKQILDASQRSMGMDISEIDMLNIKTFAERVLSLGAYRKQLHDYLNEKMAVVAPNLGALIGEVVAARLISHAGSLTNLAKCPASTVQILGAEKALFRALKTKGNTPKYGIIFHSSFIGRAGAKNKGRISRYLANKCSIASRIDQFSDVATSAFGEKLKSQVEDRLTFYQTGKSPKRNIDAMREVLETVKMTIDDDGAGDGDDKKKKKKKKKKEEAEAPAVDKKEKKKKKKSKDADQDKPKKKTKKRKADEEEAEEKPKKKKKKKKA